MIARVIPGSFYMFCGLKHVLKNSARVAEEKTPGGNKSRGAKGRNPTGREVYPPSSLQINESASCQSAEGTTIR